MGSLLKNPRKSHVLAKRLKVEREYSTSHVLLDAVANGND